MSIMLCRVLKLAGQAKGDYSLGSQTYQSQTVSDCLRVSQRGQRFVNLKCNTQAVLQTEKKILTSFEDTPQRFSARKV